MFIIEFISASLLMGIAIGIDAAIATSVFSAGTSNNQHIINWVVCVTLTHTLFPLLGYLSSYSGVVYFPVISPAIGVVAACLISAFLYDEIRAYRLNKYVLNHENKSDTLNQSQPEKRGTHCHSVFKFGLVLAVSWDALWSGPAKSAQVINWPDWAIGTSFILVGAVVLFMSVVSIYMTKSLLTRSHNLTRYKAVSKECVITLQYTVMAYFGLLAFCTFTLQVDISALWLIVIAFIMVTAGMRLNEPKVTLCD